MESNMDREDLRRPKIDPTDLPWVGCIKGIQTYENKLVFKRISPIISPTGKEEYLPVEIVVCSTCGKTPKWFFEKLPDFPANLKSTCE